MRPTSKKTYSLNVELTGLKSNKGNIIVALFDSNKNFLRHPVLYKTKPISNFNSSSIIVHFEKIPIGEYAISVIHDENKNQKLDRNFLGIPKEGFGFSNNPKIRMGPASFSECKFSIKDKDVDIRIQMKNLL